MNLAPGINPEFNLIFAILAKKWASKCSFRTKMGGRIDSIARPKEPPRGSVARAAQEKQQVSDARGELTHTAILSLIRCRFRVSLSEWADVAPDAGTLQPRSHGSKADGAGQVGKRSDGRTFNRESIRSWEGKLSGYVTIHVTNTPSDNAGDSATH